MEMVICYSYVITNEPVQFWGDDVMAGSPVHQMNTRYGLNESTWLLALCCNVIGMASNS